MKLPNGSLTWAIRIAVSALLVAVVFGSAMMLERSREIVTTTGYEGE